MYLEKIHFSRLRKLELPEFADRVMGIVEKHDPESLKIQEAFDLLVAEQPQIDALVVRFGAHPLTKKLEPLRKERTLYATAISFQMRGYARGLIFGDEDAVIVAKEAVDRFLLNLRSNNEEIINRRITQFFAEIDSDEELETAFATLGLTALLNDLRNVHSSIAELLAKRLNDISKRPKGKSEVFAKSVREALNLLFMQITFMQKINKEMDYLPLIDELNELIIRYRGLINIRAAYQEKKAENDSVETTPETQSASRMGSVDNFGQSMDQKKTVASSSKHLQLPVVEKEA